MNITKSYYQSKVYNNATNAYKLPENLYRQMIYTIKDYPRYMNEKNGISEIPLNPGDTKSFVENMAVLRTNNNYRIVAIDKALENIPEDLREEVFAHIVYNKKYIDINYTCENTMKKYVQIFIYFVAKNLGEV